MSVCCFGSVFRRESGRVCVAWAKVALVALLGRIAAPIGTLGGENERATARMDPQLKAALREVSNPSKEFLLRSMFRVTGGS